MANSSHLAPSAYWLFKTEPETYSFQQLQKDGKTFWNGVRNFQARNFLKQVQPGDQILIYHSGKERAVVGSARAVSSAVPEIDSLRPGDWVQVEISAHGELPAPVTLAEIKKTKGLQDILLVRQSRLSVCPLSSSQFRLICRIGGAPL